MATIFSVAISAIALVISLIAAWLTIFHRGSIKMTRPSFLAFVRGDGPNPNAPKVFLRTLLYTTGKRGQALEHMFARVRQTDKEKSFPFWGNGFSSELQVGSGLFIGPDGHAANHHFLLTDDSPEFALSPGAVTIEVFGSVAGSDKPKLLKRIDLQLSEDQAQAFESNLHSAIFFTWHPDESRYHSRIDERPPKQRTHSVSGSGHGKFPFE